MEEYEEKYISDTTIVIISVLTFTLLMNYALGCELMDHQWMAGVAVGASISILVYMNQSGNLTLSKKKKSTKKKEVLISRLLVRFSN